jgi:membrane-associated phospholipid phosphatase
MVEGTTSTMARSRGRRLLRAAGAAVACGVPVLLLTFAVRQRLELVIRFDEHTIAAGTDLTRRLGLAPAFVVVEQLTRPVVLHLLALVVLTWAWVVHGLRARALWAFATLSAGWLLGFGAKLVVQRVRPVLDEPLSRSDGYSFPSGHALNITLVTTVLLVLLWPLLTAGGRRVAVPASAVAVVVVGLNRILLGAHFPSDVIAGMLLGLVVTYSSWLGFLGGTPPRRS